MDHDDLVTWCLTLQNLLAREEYAIDLEEEGSVKNYLAKLRRNVRAGTITRDDLLAASLRVGEDATDDKDRLKALELVRKTLLDIDASGDGEEEEGFDDILNKKVPATDDHQVH